MNSGPYFNCRYPNYCANCGKELSNFSMNPDEKEDWNSQAVYTCECGVSFLRIIENENLSKGISSLLN